MQKTHNTTKNTHNTTQKMQLSYDNLLLHLANDYNNVLLHHTSSRSKHCNSSQSYYIDRKKRKREEEKKDEQLREIEDWLVVLLCLRNKRRRIEGLQTNACWKRRGMTYERNILYFTNPDTGERSIMTYRHSLWYQTYILNAQPEKKW